MFRCVFVATLVAVSVTACSPVPQYRTDPRINPADVAKRVYCELLLARQDSEISNLKLDDYKAAFALGLKVESNVNPNVKADWVIPYHLTDTFTSNATAGVDDYVLRDSSIKYPVVIASLTPADCPTDLKNAYLNDKDEAQMPYGSFGLLNWLSETSRTAKQTGVSPLLDYYTVKFAVTTSGNPAPGFKIVNLTGTVNLTIKRIDANTHNVVFAKKSKDEPQKVCVTNLPGAQPCEVKPSTPPTRKLKTFREREGVRTPSRMPSTVDPQLDRKLENLQLRDILRP